MSFQPNSSRPWLTGAIPVTGTNLLSITTPNDGLFHCYWILVFINVSAFTSGSLSVYQQYYDWTDTLRNSATNLEFLFNNGITGAIAAVGDYEAIGFFVISYPNAPLKITTTGSYSLTGTYVVSVQEIL